MAPWSPYQDVAPILGGATGLRIILADGGLGDADGLANRVIVVFKVPAG